MVTKRARRRLHWSAALAFLAGAPLHAAGIVTEVPIPQDRSVGVAGDPFDRIWFTDGGNQIGLVYSLGITSYTVPLATSLGHIAVAHDGTVWATDHGDRVYRLNPTAPFAPGGITSYLVGPCLGCTGTEGIVAGPDGNVWFCEYYGNKIGKVTPSGNVTEYPLASAALPKGIAVGSDGKLWYTASDLGSIGSIDVAGNVGTLYHLPPNMVGAGPVGIAAGPNLLAVTEQYQTKVALFQIDIHQFISELAIPSGQEGHVITYGPDGAFWFTIPSANKIGRFVVGGAVAEIDIPTAASNPYGIATGRDGNIWFGEASSTQRLGKIHIRGDVNGDGKIDVSDVFYMINFLFAGGPPPK